MCFNNNNCVFINIYVLNYYTLACFCFLLLLMLRLNNTKPKNNYVVLAIYPYQTAFKVWFISLPC